MDAQSGKMAIYRALCGHKKMGGQGGDRRRAISLPRLDQHVGDAAPRTVDPGVGEGVGIARRAQVGD